MNFTVFIGIGIVLVILVMSLLIFKADKKYIRKKPCLLSLIALGLITLNWVLYLIGFYVMIPEKVSDLIFIPIWFLVCAFSLIAASKGFRNNYILSVLNGGLSIISSIFGVLLLIIGSM